MERYTYTVQYQEIDASRRLRLHTLENYLLNAAGNSADEYGIGSHNLNPRGFTWVLIRLSMEIDDLPTQGDELTIETWVTSNKHMLSERCFRMYKNGIFFGQANSSWAIINLKSRSLENLFEEKAFLDYPFEPSLEIAPASQIRPLKIAEEKAVSYTIQYTDVDYNNHCNSTKYVEMMLNTYPKLATLPVKRLDIIYSKEVRFGEKVTICFGNLETSMLQFEIRNSAGDISCSMRVIY